MKMSSPMANIWMIGQVKKPSLVGKSTSIWKRFVRPLKSNTNVTDRATTNPTQPKLSRITSPFTSSSTNFSWIVKESNFDLVKYDQKRYLLDFSIQHSSMELWWQLQKGMPMQCRWLVGLCGRSILPWSQKLLEAAQSGRFLPRPKQRSAHWSFLSAHWGIFGRGCKRTLWRRSWSWPGPPGAFFEWHNRICKWEQTPRVVWLSAIFGCLGEMDLIS